MKQTREEETRKYRAKPGYREKASAYAKAWRARNKERCRQLKRDWRLKNKELAKASWKRYNSKRKTDPALCIASRLRARLSMALKCNLAGKAYSTKELLGADFPVVLAHIESTFKEGMSWQNRHLWHIDHIRPCASYDLTDHEQQKACFHYTNLQALWARENLIKAAKHLNTF